MVLANRFIGDLSYVDMLFVIVLGWIMVALWQRYIDNLTFNYLKLNKESPYHTFIIALVVTIIFLTFVFTFNSLLGDIVENDTGGQPHPPAPPTPIAARGMLEMNYFDDPDSNVKYINLF